MKKIRLRKKDVGRFVRVMFDDSGASDGIITRVDSSDDFRFLPFMGNDDMHNNGAPAVVVGKRIEASMFV